MYIMRYYDSFSEALLNGMFMSVSATTNSGFDITGSSMHPYFNDYFMQTVIMILIILGAIGFPVLIEVKSYFLEKSAEFPVFTFHENYDRHIRAIAHLGCTAHFHFGVIQLF